MSGITTSMTDYMKANPKLKYVFFGGKGRSGQDHHGRGRGPVVCQTGEEDPPGFHQPGPQPEQPAEPGRFRQTGV